MVSRGIVARFSNSSYGLLLPPRSVSQRGVTYFAKISAKTSLSAKPFKPVYQRPRWV